MTIYSHEWETLAGLVYKHTVEQIPEVTIPTSLLSRLIEKANEANDLREENESLLDELDEARRDLSYLEDQQSLY